MAAVLVPSMPGCTGICPQQDGALGREVEPPPATHILKPKWIREPLDSTGVIQSLKRLGSAAGWGEGGGGKGGKGLCSLCVME